MSIQTVISSQKSVRLIRPDLPLLYSCWLFPRTFLSFRDLKTATRRIYSITFPGAEVRL